MIVDLFAGPGGWSEGLRTLGLEDIGLEWDEAACATRAAAGHLTIRTDVAEYPPQRFTGADGLIASPPCQDFSIAGKRAGREGDRGQLIDVVPEWVRVIRPLPIWHEHAAMYEQLGYRTWVGVLNAADYGVPQTRRRAFLLASLNRQPQPPAPTHAEYPQPSLFGDAPQRWVSMAEALGWGLTDGPYPTIASSRSTGGPDREQVGGSGARAALYGRKAAGAWLVRGRQPNTAMRTLSQPCYTVLSSWDNGTAAELHTEDGPIKLTEWDALVLQSFRADYPLRGTRTKRFQQVGNAVPPLLAAAVVKAVAS